MIEILILLVFGKLIGDSAREKHRNPLAYQLLLVICWLGGELGGVFAGAALFQYMKVEGMQVNPRAIWIIYVIAIIGAFLGLALAFAILGSLGSRKRRRSYSADEAKTRRLQNF